MEVYMGSLPAWLLRRIGYVASFCLFYSKGGKSPIFSNTSLSVCSFSEFSGSNLFIEVCPSFQYFAFNNSPLGPRKGGEQIFRTRRFGLAPRLQWFSSQKIRFRDPTTILHHITGPLLASTFFLPSAHSISLLYTWDSKVDSGWLYCFSILFL